MLKQTFAKCPRRRGCAGMLKQGQARGQPNPTPVAVFLNPHLPHLLLFFSTLQQSFFSFFLFMRPIYCHRRFPHLPHPVVSLFLFHPAHCLHTHWTLLYILSLPLSLSLPGSQGLHVAGPHVTPLGGYILKTTPWMKLDHAF